jgi:hypothetical protein
LRSAGILDNEMTFDLQLAVEAKALTDINATSGIQTQAYATSVLTTLRKGLTTLETAGSLALHPMDWNDVELARASSNVVEHLSLPYDPAYQAAARRAGHHLQRASRRCRSRNRQRRSRSRHPHPRRGRNLERKCDRGLVR